MFIWNWILRHPDGGDGGGMVEETPEVVEEAPGAETEDGAAKEPNEADVPIEGSEGEGQEERVPKKRFNEIYRKHKEAEERAEKAERQLEEFLDSLRQGGDPYGGHGGRQPSYQPQPYQPQTEPKSAAKTNWVDSLPEQVRDLVQRDQTGEFAEWIRIMSTLIDHKVNPFQEKMGAFEKTYGQRFQEIQREKIIEQAVAELDEVQRRVFDSSPLKGHPAGDDLMAVAITRANQELNSVPNYFGLPRPVQIKLFEQSLARQVSSLSGRIGASARPNTDKAAAAAKKAPATAIGRSGSPPEKDDLREKFSRKQISSEEFLSRLTDRGAAKAGG